MQSNNKKRVSNLLIAGVLVGAIVAGATFAWLNDRADQTNTFQYTKSGIPEHRKDEAVSIQLGEPQWGQDKGYQFQPYAHNDVPDGAENMPANIIYKPGEEEAGKAWNPNGAAPDANGKGPDGFSYGFNKASNFIPGLKMNKNPIVKAIGYEPTFVGVKVSGKGLTLAELEQIFEINWNLTGKWMEIPVSGANTEGNRFFVYKETLVPYDAISTESGAAKYPDLSINPWTEQLFTKVVAKNETAANKAIYDKISGASAADSEIFVEAFSVQAINESTGGWSGEDNTDVDVADGSAPLRALQAEFSSLNADRTDASETVWDATR